MTNQSENLILLDENLRFLSENDPKIVNKTCILFAKNEQLLKDFEEFCGKHFNTSKKRNIYLYLHDNQCELLDEAIEKAEKHLRKLQTARQIVNSERFVRSAKNIWEE